jgi:methylglyoxal synthase
METHYRLREKKRMALLAHESMQADLIAWAAVNRDYLMRHDLYATGSVASLMTDLGFKIEWFGKDLQGNENQVGARIFEGEVDLMILFWDPLEMNSVDFDIQSLLNIASLHNIPTACNRASADFLISSYLMYVDYDRSENDFEKFRYMPRMLKKMIAQSFSTENQALMLEDDLSPTFPHSEEFNV